MAQVSGNLDVIKYWWGKKGRIQMGKKVQGIISGHRGLVQVELHLRSPQFFLT